MRTERSEGAPDEEPGGHLSESCALVPHTKDRLVGKPSLWEEAAQGLSTLDCQASWNYRGLWPGDDRYHTPRGAASGRE